MTFDIRSATAQDYDDVYALFSEVQMLHAESLPEIFRQPTKDEAFQSFFAGFENNDEHFLALATLDDNPIGYIQYSLSERRRNIYQPDRRFAYIHQLIVTREQHRRGYGSKLIDFVKQQMRARGISEIGIDFWSFNDAARGCFEGLGFKVQQERMWLFE